MKLKGYEDIIGLPHYEPRGHRRMSSESRAAQFAPFSALTGYEDAIAEEGRQTLGQLNMSTDYLIELSQRLTYLLSFDDKPTVEITFFVPDGRKNGGGYVKVSGRVKRVEPAENLLILEGGRGIYLDMIAAIEGDIFADIE